ncbi:hypothetical protein, partial [Serratia marcescens]
MRSSLWIGLAATALAASPALAQEKPQSTTKQAEDIATQPAKDVGVVKTKIPPVLERAAENP